MEEFAVSILFGHIAGDFFLQTGSMADHKYRPGKIGALWCTAHVAVYTITVSAILGNFSVLFMLGVYIPHWIIDRWSLGYRWMILIGRGHLLKSNNPHNVAFGSIVYVVIDQTMHLICLYCIVFLMY